MRLPFQQIDDRPDGEPDGDRSETGDDDPAPIDSEAHPATDETDSGSGSALVGAELAIGYPTTEEPVVECGRVDIPQGEVTALVGPNGSGKSTLLKGLSSHLAPDDGTVLLHGRDLQSFEGKELARELGLLSQENESLGSITVEDLAYHGRYPHRDFFDSLTEPDHRAVDRALDLAGVAHIRDAELGQLSGGQKQLAWIAMVLAQDTDVLLLDEPTTYLDVYHQFRVLETIRELNERQDVTVAVVLHDVSQAARFADYLVAMCDGELYDWGPPADVVTEQLLADVFGIEAEVEYEPELQIKPRRALPNRRT